MLSGNDTPVRAGVIDPVVVTVIPVAGPTQACPVMGTPVAVTVIVASAIAAPRASRATGLIATESLAVSTMRSASTPRWRAT